MHVCMLIEMLVRCMYVDFYLYVMYVSRYVCMYRWPYADMYATVSQRYKKGATRYFLSVTCRYTPK